MWRHSEAARARWRWRGAGAGAGAGARGGGMPPEAEMPPAAAAAGRGRRSRRGRREGGRGCGARHRAGGGWRAPRGVVPARSAHARERRAFAKALADAGAADGEAASTPSRTQRRVWRPSNPSTRRRSGTKCRRCATASQTRMRPPSQAHASDSIVRRGRAISGAADATAPMWTPSSHPRAALADAVRAARSSQLAVASVRQLEAAERRKYLEGAAVALESVVGGTCSGISGPPRGIQAAGGAASDNTGEPSHDGGSQVAAGRPASAAALAASVTCATRDGEDCGGGGGSSRGSSNPAAGHHRQGSLQKRRCRQSWRRRRPPTAALSVGACWCRATYSSAQVQACRACLVTGSQALRAGRAWLADVLPREGAHGTGARLFLPEPTSAYR